MRELSIAGSSNIQGVYYDEESHELTVQFRKGTYVYKNVPEETAMGFESAPSSGTYLNLFIKPLYEYERAG